MNRTEFEKYVKEICPFMNKRFGHIGVDSEYFYTYCTIDTQFNAISLAVWHDSTNIVQIPKYFAFRNGTIIKTDPLGTICHNHCFSMNISINNDELIISSLQNIAKAYKNLKLKEKRKQIYKDF